MMMCGGCHYNRNDNALSGKRLYNFPAYFGKIYSANLTGDASGIAHYRKEDLRLVVRTGQMIDGRISRFMGTPQISNRDIESIIEFLKSDDPLIRPIERTVPETRLSLLARFYLLFKAPLSAHSKQIAEGSVQGEPNSQGKYLVAILECYGCHSGGWSGINKRDPERSSGYMAGGTQFVGIDGNPVRSANLTGDLESGIGKWNARDFEKAMTKGISPDGKSIRFPMPIYPHLTKGEIGSIFSYLQSLKPVRHLIDRDN